MKGSGDEIDEGWPFPQLDLRGLRSLRRLKVSVSEGWKPHYNNRSGPEDRGLSNTICGDPPIESFS